MNALLFEVEYIVHHIEDPRYLMGGQGGMNDFEQEVRRGCFSKFVVCVANQQMGEQVVVFSSMDGEWVLLGKGRVILGDGFIIIK